MSKKRRQRQVEGGGSTSVPGTPEASGGTRALWLWLPLLAVLVLWAHGPSLASRALSFDDASYLSDNPLVRAPSWNSARRFFTEVLEPSTVRGYYQPLAMTSLMLDHALGGRPDNLRPFHRTSLLLHALNTVLVALLLWSLFGEMWVAVIVAALFGLHPLTVEPIPWVGERKTLLAAGFVLGSLLCYVRYARRGTKLGYAGALGFFVLALLSKPTSTPLPALLMLLDIWPLGRLKPAKLRAWCVEKIPFLGVAAVSAWITYESQRRTAVATLPGDASPGRIPLTICHNIVFYLLKIVWPANLSSHYPVPEPLSLGQPMVLAGVCGTLVLLPALVWSLRYTRALLVGWLFFFVAVFPTLGVVGFTNVIASDKYAYLPSVGLLMALAYLLGRLWNGGETPDHRRRVRLVVVAVAAVLGTCEVAVTRAYYAEWSDSERLLRHMLKLAPESPEVLNALGSLLVQEQRVDEAIGLYRKALAARPDSIAAHINLGQAFFAERRHAEAAREFEAALALHPQPMQAAYAHGNLGVSLKQLGRVDEAVEHYREAIRADPGYVTPRGNLANLLREQGKTEEAIQEYRAALVINPLSASLHNGLGAALFAIDRYGEAAAEFVEAVRLDPRNTEAGMNQALALSRTGDVAQTLAAYRRVFATRPGDAGLRVTAANALFGLGHLAAAAQLYEEALAIEPGNEQARRWLAVTKQKLVDAQAGR